MAKERKTERRWDPAKARKWGIEQKRRNEIRRAQGFKVGDSPFGSGAGRTSNPGGGMDGRSRPGPESDNNRAHPGQYDGPPGPAETSTEETETPAEPESVLDMDAVWQSLPELYKLAVLGLQNWADLFNWYNRKIFIVFVPLNDKEAKTLATFSRPFLEKKLPQWVQKNPGLAMCCVPLFVLLFKVKVGFKKPAPGTPGQVIEVNHKEAA